MPTPAETIRRIQHEARGVLTSAHLSIHGLGRGNLSEQDRKRLTLLTDSLKRLDGLLSELDVLAPEEEAKE